LREDQRLLERRKRKKRFGEVSGRAEAHGRSVEKGRERIESC
jgi:hypothetical protein